MKVKESELREITEAFKSCGHNLDVVQSMLKAGQEYPAMTHLEYAITSYRNTQRRLQELVPAIDWGLEYEERKH
jgi:hypothetical protein